MASLWSFLDNILRWLNINTEDNENQAVNNAVETTVNEVQPETPMTDKDKKEQSLWWKALSSNRWWNILNSIDTQYAWIFWWVPGVWLKLYHDYQKNQKKKAYEEQKPTITWSSVDNPSIVTPFTTDEETQSYKTTEEMPFWDWVDKWTNTLWLIINNLHSYSWTKHFKDDFEDTYKEDINKIYQWRQWLLDWSVTQEQYDDYVRKYAEEAMRAHWRVDIDRPSTFWVNTVDRVVQSINNDINNLGSSQNIQDKIAKLDPQWAAEEQSNTKITNEAINHIMEWVNEELKYYKWSKEEIVKDAYNTSESIVSRLVNAYAPARRVITSLQARYWTLDTTHYTLADKELLDYAEHITDAVNAFIINYWDYYKALVRQADPDTNTLIVPEILNWLNYHDWVFKGMDWILTDEDYEWLYWFDRENFSAIDVIENMSANLATRNADINWNWWDWLWTNFQHLFRPIWPVVQEAGQQTFWQAYLNLYNTASNQTWKIDFNMLNEDNTIVSTMSSNKSTAWRLIQKYTANVMEYAPEITSEIWFTMWWAWIPAKVRNISEFRLLSNNWILRTLKAINKASKSKWVSLISWLREAANTGKIVKDWGTLLDISKELWVPSNWSRALNWITTDFVPEIAWDQVIDASLSSADTDFGSDASMAFSLWGTILGNIIWKLWEVWLYRMGRNWLNNIIRRENPLKNITEWTVWDFLNIVDPENINKLLRLQYWWKNSLNVAQLSELSKYVSDYREISNLTKKALWAISTEDARRVTQAVKNWVYREIKPYIDQVYGWQSEFARKVAQLAADDRTNVADLTKYILGIDSKIWVFWWTSKISLADSASRYATNYKESLDTVFNDWSFRRKMKEWFNLSDIEELQKKWYSWANLDKWYMKKVWDDTYFFTKDWLDAAKNDIMTTSLSMPVLSKASQSAEDFDSLMKNATFRKISDETLQDIKNSGAYDTLADALAEIEQLCWITV